MIYPPYIRVSGRVEFQVSVLTGLGAIGYYNQHSTAKILLDGRIYEVPVLTGNSLKHWHAVYLAEAYEALGGKRLNEFCRRGLGIRGYKASSGLSEPQKADTEIEAIEDLCNDIHGFLIPEKQVKRDSLVKTSFLIPVLTKSNVEAASKFAIQHNKVVPASVKEEEMALFKQEYATALYGFNIKMDLGFSLIPLYEEGEPKAFGASRFESSRGGCRPGEACSSNIPP